MAPVPAWVLGFGSAAGASAAGLEETRMRFQRPRGTQDLLPQDAPRWRHVTGVMRTTLDSFGYADIRTPLFEDTELFVRGVGNATDIVAKEMYTFADRKGRNLTLRPEGTAPVVRAYLENNLDAEPGLCRLQYMGPMFRYDRPQAGRYREFFQVGAEAIGSPLPEVDVEIIDAMMTMLYALGLRQLGVEINSVGHPGCRADYEVTLRAALAAAAADLCATCNERAQINPLRVFDCKNPACRPTIERLPLLRAALCGDCRRHHAAVAEGLTALGLAYTENPRLVRGLDYYTRTAFEVHYPPLGAQSALGGGGRYDGLVEACGGPPTPAVGFSAGIERVLVAIAGLPLAPPAPSIWLVPLGDAARRQALVLARALRPVAAVHVDLTGRGLKAQLRGADRNGARLAILLGDDEMARGEASIRDLAAGTQIAAPWAELPAAVRRILDETDGTTT
jgi:histidyl-tRNA synthetase